MPKTHSFPDKSVAVIGGGPAGLMAAEVICRAGVRVDVYDAMPSMGRKFLMAGKGGLNITHSEPFDRFASRYGTAKDFIQPLLERFDADALREWVSRLGINTFVGSSGRVFPKEMKAAPLLRAWLHRLRQDGVAFHVRHQWLGWKETDARIVQFITPQGLVDRKADAVVLALGGGSWPQLGSTGQWVSVLQSQGVKIAPLMPSNCGFDVNWSDQFRQRFAGHPIKTIVASFGNIQSQGDCVVTETGIEGGVIYALSAALRDGIARSGTVTLFLDLAPGKSLAALIEKISRPRGKQSLSNHLRKNLGIDGVKSGLLFEVLSHDEFKQPAKLCSALKSLPIELVAARPLAEAISSAGGVSFDAVDGRLMLNSMPGIFCCGEMLDWEAPTGGYLLTACFASGRVAGDGVLDWFGLKTVGT